MKPLYKKYLLKAAVFWGVCAVVFIAIFFLILIPQGRDKIAIEKQLAEAKNRYDSIMRLSSQAGKKQLTEEIEFLKTGWKEYVIDSYDWDDLMFDINQISKDREMSSFSNRSSDITNEEVEIPDCKYICEKGTNIRFNSDFKQFAIFLNEVERHRPVVFVDDFSITRSPQDNTGHKVTMDLSAFVRIRGGS